MRVQVVYDRAFFDALSTPHKVFEPLCSHDRYHELLQAADIGLLPLEPTRFNRHKSDLKFIECAANGVAALASPTVYGRTIAHDETGLIYQSPTEFGAMLERLIRERPLRRRLASNAFQLCRSESDASASLPDALPMVSPDAQCKDALEAELQSACQNSAAAEKCRCGLSSGLTCKALAITDDIGLDPRIRSKRVRRDDFTPGAGGNRLPDERIYRIFGEDNVAVAIEDIDAAGMEAAGGLPAGVVIDNAVGPAGIRGQVVIIQCILIVAVPPARPSVQEPAVARQGAGGIRQRGRGEAGHGPV